MSEKKPNPLVVFIILCFIVLLLYASLDKIFSNDYYVTKWHDRTIKGPHQLNWGEKLFPWGFMAIAIIGGFFYFIYERFLREKNKKDKEQ